jgi:multidrug transporter EmrE-like cation transporter
MPASVFRKWFNMPLEGNPVLIAALFIVNLLFNIVANSGFKLSAQGHSWSHFLTWQVIGNLAGLVTVLTLTGLLRFLPLHVAYPITTGFAVIGVQVIAASWFFSEQISIVQWMGSLLVVFGILLIGNR